jgi:adenylate cyclase
MESRVEVFFDYVKINSLAEKIRFLKNQKGFESLQILFFGNKTAGHLLGVESIVFLPRLEQLPRSDQAFFELDKAWFDQNKIASKLDFSIGNTSVVAALKIKGDVFGFILIEGASLTQVQQTVLYSLKQQFEFELSNIKLETKLKVSEKELSYKLLEIESLIDVTNIVNESEQELDALFESLLITILSTLNASKGMILLKDSKTNFFNVASSFNLDNGELPSKIIRITKGIFKRLDEEKESLVIDDFSDYPLLQFSQKNVLISPLVNQDELVGAIILADKESRSGLVRFIQQDLRLFDNLSKKVSLAYDNIRLIDSLQTSNKLVDNIMTSITTGIIKINILGELEYVNHSAKKIFGLEDELALNNHYYIVFQNNPHIISLIEKSEGNLESIIQEENVKIENELGESHEINLTLSTVYDESNVPSGLVFSFEDLSGINKIKSTFKKYVSENIVDELLKNETSLELGGSQNEVCILFCDIRGFTSMSEKMKPNEVVYLLNHYFDAMIEVVFNHNGTLDKIIGDELMVLYGVPLKNKNDAQSAVDSAIAMFEALNLFNKQMLEQNYPQLKIGIGINYGRVVCGNIGSERQMNYTVIGDHVNLAARLCSHARSGEIVISSSVIDQLESKKGFVQKDPILVKGKKDEIPNWIYSVNS